jgi:hypothetical protein
LWYQPDLLAELVTRILVDGYIIQQDRASSWTVETKEQVQQSSFARPIWTKDGSDRTWVDIKRDFFQRGLRG